MLSAVRQEAERAEIDRCAQRLIDLLASLIADIRGVVAADSQASVPVDATRLDAVLRQLMPLLQKGSMAANDMAVTEEKLLRATLGQDGDEVLRRIARFDYKGALSVLQGRADKEGTNLP